MTDDIVTFIKIRLHEDQTAALDALRDWPPGDEIAGQVESILVGAHVHRHNPQRTLRGVEARRRLLDLHATIDVYDWNPSGHCRECSDSGWEGAGDGADAVQQPCPTLRVVASEWSTHADFKPGWTP